MDPRRAPGSAIALALAVGLVAAVLAAAEVAVRYTPSTWIQRDGRFYTNVNVTLVESGSVVQDEFAASWYSGELGWNRNLDAAWSNLALGRGDRRLPKHPILLPLLATPLFWAFGLPGTLLFNVLMFGLIGGAAFAVGRRYGSVPAAVFAAMALALATGIRDHAYDYHVDVLILGLFTSGMALALARRGLWAGVLIGLAVVARPTALLWLPSLVLLMVERRARRELGWAILGGAIPLVLYALSNWWLFGAPWWSGYNRVLVVVDGAPQVADVGDAFSVPLEEGLRNLWQGPYGVRTRLPLMFAAAPGLLLMARRRPLYVLAAILGVTASVLLFARYRWYGDRFLWPSCALLVPALVAGVDALARALRRPEWRAPGIAALAGMIVVGAHAAVGPPFEQRFEDGWTQLALVLLGTGALCVGVTRSSARAVDGPIAALAPMILLLLPGVRDRLLVPDADLALAAALTLALGARRWPWSLAFAGLAGVAVASAAPSLHDTASLLEHLDGPAGRPTLILVALGFPAAAAMGTRAALLAPLALLGLDRVAGVADGPWPLFALALLAVAATALVVRVGAALHGAGRDARPLGRGLAVASVLGALLITGLVARADAEPFRIASYRGVRTADVYLGEVPCDFLAWEHLNWECSTYDRGVRNETGLVTSDPLEVGGREAGLFLISAPRAWPRIVRWEGVEADARLTLRYAVPDGLRGGGRLTVRIDETTLREIALPTSSDEAVHELALDTARWAGRRVTLELRLEGAGTAVGVDGGFDPRPVEAGGAGEPEEAAP